MKATIPIEHYEAAKNSLNYCPDTGEFTWAVTRSNRAKKGTKAGINCPRGYLYIRITIEGKYHRLLGSRIAWYIINGKIPEGLHIDHINGDKSDNRINNLRPCTASQNHMNRRPARNTSGVVGVNKSSTNRWRVRIKVGHNNIPLGNFKSFDEAVKARKAAEVKYFGEYAYKKE